MTREYLVIYEHGERNWSSFSPDVQGCGSLGTTLDEVKENTREAIEFHLQELAKAGDPIPEAVNSIVNFDEFDPEHTQQYVVEWLSVSLPESVPNYHYGLKGVA